MHAPGIQMPQHNFAEDGLESLVVERVVADHVEMAQKPGARQIVVSARRRRRGANVLKAASEKFSRDGRATNS